MEPRDCIVVRRRREFEDTLRKAKEQIEQTKSYPKVMMGRANSSAVSIWW